jgi:small conductance mechanosensitive channel
VNGLMDSAVQITLQAWVKADDWWQVKADLMQGGKEALDAADIEIPFPHQVAVPYGDEKDVLPMVQVRTEAVRRRPAGGGHGED